VVGEPQTIELKKEDGTYYCNYICRSRYEEQCFSDGTFDTYYDEWCEDALGQKIEVALPKKTSDDNYGEQAPTTPWPTFKYEQK
jgi:hypothetical protein